MKRVDINKFKNTKENKRVRRLVTILHFLVLVDKYFEGGEKDKALKDRLERELVRFISIPGLWKYVCKDGNVASPVEPIVDEPITDEPITDEPIEEVIEPVVEEPIEETVEEVIEPVVEEPIEETVEEESNEIETVNE